jgi:hypothetical protein
MIRGVLQVHCNRTSGGCRAINVASVHHAAMMEAHLARLQGKWHGPSRRLRGNFGLTGRRPRSLIEEPCELVIPWPEMTPRDN